MVAAANVSAATFHRGLAQYARQHTRAAVPGAPAGARFWIGEDLHPDGGYWLSRALRLAQACNDDCGADPWCWCVRFASRLAGWALALGVCVGGDIGCVGSHFLLV